MSFGEILRDERELPAELAALYPFKRQWTDVGQGVRMHWAEAGEGPAVVLLHGNPSWSFLWRAFLPKLAAAGFRAIAPDLVGFGLSDKILDPRYQTPERHLENLGRFIDALGLESLTLAVHDWGGPIGLGWAGRNPSRVKRLAIFNTMAFAPRRSRPLSPWHRVFASRLGDPLALRANLLLESAMRFGVAHRERMRGAVLEAYRFPFRTPPTRVGPLAMARCVPTGPDHPQALTLAAIEDNLRELKDKPAVVLWGDADPIFKPGGASKWKKTLPGINEVKRYPRGGHFLQEDEPEALSNALVAWLRANPV